MVTKHLTFLVKQTKNRTNVFFILGIHRGLENRKLKEFYSAINSSINHATNFHSRNNATVYVIQDNSVYYGNHVIVFTTKYHRCTYNNYVSAYVIIYTTNYHRNNINCHNSSTSSTAESITSSTAPTTTTKATTVATTVYTSSTEESTSLSSKPPTTTDTTTVATTSSTSSESTTSSSTFLSTTETPSTTPAKTASSTIFMTFSTLSRSDSSPSVTGKKLVDSVQLNTCCKNFKRNHRKGLSKRFRRGSHIGTFTASFEKERAESNEEFFSRNQKVILSASLVGFCLIVIVGVMLYLFKRRILLRQKTLNIRLPGMTYDRFNIV